MSFSLNNKTTKTIHGKITLSAQSFNSDQQHQVPEMSLTFTAEKGMSDVEALLNIGDGMLTWDEFDPALYKLRTMVSFDKQTIQKRNTIRYAGN